MALSPIQIFANPSSQGLLGILSGSQNALTMGLQSAIQIGRDLSNKAVQQERDFLRERRSEENMAQRRGENLQQQFNADRNFSRMTANDLFSQEMQRDQFAAQTSRDEFGREMQEDRFKLDQQQEQRMGTESRFRMDEVKRDEEFNRGLLTPRDIFGPQLPPDKQDPFALSAEADLKIEAARKARNPDALRDATMQKAEADRIKAERRAAGTAADGTESPAEARAARSEQRMISKAEEAKREKRANELLADSGAFPSQTQFVTPEDITKGTPSARSAVEWDKDRPAAERLAAEGVSREEYISKGDQGRGLTPTQRKRRGEFWDLVNGSAPTSVSTPASAGSYVRDAAKALE